MNSFKVSSNIKICTTVIFICLYLQSTAQKYNLIFQSTFDSPTSIKSWHEQSILHTWSAVFVTNNYRTGPGSLKVELIRGLDTANGPRAELGMAPKSLNEYWYGFSNFFPADYASDPATEIINQWQAPPDFSLGETWRSPPLALEIKMDRYKIAIRWSAYPVNNASNTNVDYLDLGPVTHEKWNDWVFHIKWSYNSGILQIWKNGTLVLERLNKPIGYNDLLYPYLKIGIYKWEWHDPNTISTSKNRTYYIDEVRVGNKLATYFDVDPGHHHP